MESFNIITSKYRTIVSPVPHPDSIPIMERLRQLEPRSMAGFSPVVWHRAEGFQVWDAYGNRWIDFTSSVVLTNAGHANPRIRDAIMAQLEANLWHNYCNPSDIRLQMAESLASILPAYLEKVFLLSTGSEAAECAIKLARMHGSRLNDGKYHIVSFQNSFHGRTMASQRAGGFPEQQAWMGAKPEGFHHIPFPDCSRCPWGKAAHDGCGRECWNRSIRQLEEEGVEGRQVAAVISETFQGPTVAFLPADYVSAMREWCSQHRALLIFDEIQAGFGRTGRWFGFEHYGVEPDLIIMGKGMTSSLPMSAVAGRKEIMDLPGHSEMSSSHTGNPLCCAAAIANIEAIREEGLPANAASLEPVVRARLESIRSKFPQYVGWINGKGLVWAVGLLRPGTKELNVPLARTITQRCLESGLMMLQTGRGTLKIAPPLCIEEDALTEGIELIGAMLEEWADGQGAAQ